MEPVDKWSKLEELLDRKFTEYGFKKKTKVDFSNGKFTGLTEQQISAWQEAYPAADIQAETKRAAAWIVSNPSLAPKSNFARFLNTWLMKVQNQASLRSIPTVRTVEKKNCSYCERPASTSVNGYHACDAHADKAIYGEKPARVA